jgi:hypothetical protein
MSHEFTRIYADRSHGKLREDPRKFAAKVSA